MKFFFNDNKHNAVKLLHSTQRKNTFLAETKEKSKSQKQIPKKKFSLELLYHRLGKISTRSLMARDTVNVWQYIELRVYPDTLFTSCQISTINRKSISKTSLKSKTPFKWVLMEIIPATYSTNFNKRYYFWSLPFNCVCLFQYYKHLWNVKYHYWVSHGKTRYVSVKPWKIRWI